MEQMKNVIIPIISFFDRNYNLLFNGKKCVKTRFYSGFFEYNDIVSAINGQHKLRSLGRGWYKFLTDINS